MHLNQSSATTEQDKANLNGLIKLAKVLIVHQPLGSGSCQEDCYPCCQGTGERGTRGCTKAEEPAPGAGRQIEIPRFSQQRHTILEENILNGCFNLHAADANELAQI